MKVSIADLYKNFSNDIKQLNPELFGDLGIATAPRGTTGHGAALRELNDALKADKSDRGNKYGARKTVIDGQTFDSKAEANRYIVLKAQADEGSITGLICQCKIILLEGFTYQGQKVQPITYRADFAYVKDGITYVEDVKSVATAKTEAFRIRWRLLQWMYREREDVKCIVTGGDS